jgi:hypothetical protein
MQRDGKRRVGVGLAILFALGAVTQAQAPPSLALALQQAQANLAKRAAALQASDVFKDYEAAKAHVETLTALVKAEPKPENGSK